jgi:hypothetical protein
MFWGTDDQPGWCARVLALQPGTPDAHFTVLSDLIGVLEVHCAARPRSTERMGMPSDFVVWPTDADFLAARTAEFNAAAKHFHLLLAGTYERATRSIQAHLELCVRFSRACVPLSVASDALHYELEAQHRGFRAFVRPATEEWKRLRPIKKKENKDGEEQEVVDWNLVLQIQLGALAMRRDLVFYNGAVFRRKPEKRCVIEMLRKKVTDQSDTPMSLADMAWRDLIDEKVDPDMWHAARVDPSFIGKACSWFEHKSTPELPHVTPTTRYLAFAEHLLEIRGGDGKPSLRVIPNAHAPTDIVLQTHSDAPLEPDFLTMPLCSYFCEPVIKPPSRKRTLDADAPDRQEEKEKEEIVGWRERRGPELLEWLARKPTDAEREGFKLEETFADARFLSSRARVLMSKLAQQDFSPQMLFLLIALLGRYMHSNGTDRLQVAMWIHGAAGSGKSMLITELLNELISTDCIGSVDTSRLDNFAYAGAEHWRLMMINELRRTGGNGLAGLPEADLLKFIAGEDAQLRDFHKKGIRMPHVPFNVIFISNLEQPPFQNVAGEFARRILLFCFPNSFTGEADTSLLAQRRMENGANAVMMLRCYQLLIEALGTRMIQEVMPYDMLKANESARWEGDLVHQFLHSSHVVLHHPTTEKRLELFGESRAQRKAAPKTLISSLGDVFRRWLVATHPKSNMPWVPNKWRPAFEHLGLPFSLVGAAAVAEGKTAQWPKKYDTEQLAPMPENGYVYFVEISPQTEERLSHSTGGLGSSASAGYGLGPYGARLAGGK